MSRRPLWADANAVRPTIAGVWYLLVLAGLTFGAVNTGNNLVYVVLAVLLAVLVLNNVLAEWNLRGLDVRRVLPGELFAGEAAEGRLVLENRRRVGAALQVEVEERDGGKARARFARVGAGQAVEEPARWTFAARGTARFSTVRVGSRFPFGLVLRYRDLDLPAEVMVFPTPERGTAADAGLGVGDAAAARPTRGGIGELAGLRGYLPGDPVRTIHWPTTARVGVPVVTVRSGEGAGEVMVSVPPGSERAIRRACGQVLLHTQRGDAVGLDLGGERLSPRTGAAWRRRLLTTLAELPVGADDDGGAR